MKEFDQQANEWKDRGAAHKSNDRSRVRLIVSSRDEELLWRWIFKKSDMWLGGLPPIMASRSVRGYVLFVVLSRRPAPTPPAQTPPSTRTTTAPPHNHTQPSRYSGRIPARDVRGKSQYAEGVNC